MSVVTTLWGRANGSGRVLVVGVPRSGTSWIGYVLSRAPGAIYVNEPDSPEVNPSAAGIRSGVWEHGSLGRDDEAPPEYEALWTTAFHPPRGGRFRRHARTVVVKSVKSHPTLEWVAERFEPKILIVRANLLSVVSSWVRMGWRAWPETGIWLERWRPDLLDMVGGWPTDPVEQVAVEVGMKAWIQEELLARNPGWLAVGHEDLCA